MNAMELERIVREVPDAGRLQSNERRCRRAGDDHSMTQSSSCTSHTELVNVLRPSRHKIHREAEKNEPLFFYE